MKKSLLTLLACVFAFGLGVGVSNIAFCDTAKAKVGYVDVAKLLSNSKAIKQAEDARKKQIEDMTSWFNTANTEINQQTIPAQKQALVKKYEAQLEAKRNAIKDSYTKKITEADKQIDSVITQKAKELGYDLVFKKDSLLYGGADITAHVLPLVK